MSSISVAMSYLFYEIDYKEDMWQNQVKIEVKIEVLLMNKNTF